MVATKWAKSTCRVSPTLIVHSQHWECVRPASSEIFCEGLDDEAVTWPTTKAGAPAQGACKPGYDGNPTRDCTWKGVWLLPKGDQCKRTCRFAARCGSNQAVHVLTSPHRCGTISVFHQPIRSPHVPARRRRDGVVYFG